MPRPTTVLAAAAVALTPSCGGGGGQPDARPDAPVDAPVDAVRPDAPPPPEGDHYYYVVDTLGVPTSTTEVQTFGMDIDSDQPDGDAGVDNQLGSVLALLAVMNFDVQGATTSAIDRGDILLLADYQTTSFASAGRSGLTTYLGANPNPTPCIDINDVVCRRHLTGTATFSVDPSSPTDAIVVGPVINSVFQGGPGRLTLQIALTAGAPLRLDLIAARAELRGTSATDIGEGKLAGAIPKTEFDTRVFPAIVAAFQAAVAEDCPSPAPPNCGCASGSTGETVLLTFDANDDCQLTALELQNDPLISGFLMPDVTIDGVDALSIGVKLTAVGAVFTP